MKKILLLTLGLNLIFSCDKKENKANFKIVKSQTEKDLEIIEMATYDDAYVMSKTHDQIEVIKENKIISVIEYKYKNVGIFERDIKRYPHITYYYNDKGIKTKAVFNETTETINLEKKEKIDSIWEENQLTIKDYNERLGYKESVLNYKVENGVGELIKIKYEDTTGGEYKREYFKNKIIFTNKECVSCPEEKNVWEWKKDKEGNIVTVTLTNESGGYEVAQIEWENKKPKKVLIKESNGTITEKCYKWDGNKMVESIRYENNGYDWFSVDRYYYNSLNLISKIEHYTVDKSEYQNYCSGKKVSMLFHEYLSSEWEYFTKDKPFQAVK